MSRLRLCKGTQYISLQRCITSFTGIPFFFLHSNTPRHQYPSPCCSSVRELHSSTATPYRELYRHREGPALAAVLREDVTPSSPFIDDSRTVNTLQGIRAHTLCSQKATTALHTYSDTHTLVSLAVQCPASPTCRVTGHLCRPEARSERDDPPSPRAAHGLLHHRLHHGRVAWATRGDATPTARAPTRTAGRGVAPAAKRRADASESERGLPRRQPDRQLPHGLA